MAILMVLFSNQFDHYFTRSSKDGPNSKNFTVKTGPILLEIARIFSKLSKLLSPHTFTSILTKFEPKKQIFCNFHNKLTKKFELGLILPKIFQNCFWKNYSLLHTKYNTILTSELKFEHKNFFKFHRKNLN